MLLGGWAMSIPWWQKQLDALGGGYRVVAIDARAYGESQKVEFGHRIARHAADVRDTIEALGLRDVTLVGWSLAANTVLAYLEQFGPWRLAAGVHLEMSPYPNTQPSYPIPDPDWTLGFADVAAEQEFLDAWRADPETVAADLVDAMFVTPPAAEEKQWMVAEILKPSRPFGDSPFPSDDSLVDWAIKVFRVETDDLFGSDRGVLEHPLHPTGLGARRCVV